MSGMTSGRGDYTVNRLIKTGDEVDIVPKFAADANSVVISNQEYIKDVYAPASPTPFSISTIPINVGLPVCFPWLSQLASNYQEYELQQCIFTFKTSIESYTATGQVGQVVMATQYNPSVEAFADKETMMMYDGAASCKTTSSMLQGVECDPVKLAATTGRKYIRSGNVASTEDLKEYDQGTLNLAILNPPVNLLGQVMGELWISYTVKLTKPRLSSLNGNAIPYDIFAYYNQAGVPLTTASGGIADSLQLTGARNSFGARLYKVASVYGATQPPATIVNGVPNPGSTLDPFDIFSAPDFLPLYSGAWPPTIWTVGGTPALNVFCANYCLELPDNFQGLAEVVYTSYGRAGSGGNDFEITQYAQPLVAGNVYRFEDMPVRATTGGAYDIVYSHSKRISNDNNNAQAPNDPNWNGYTNVLHIRVQPATNGLKNRIYFGQLSTVLGATTWIPVVTEVTCAVYNASNSQSLTGKADRLVMQNTQTSLPYTTI